MYACHECVNELTTAVKSLRKFQNIDSYWKKYMINRNIWSEAAVLPSSPQHPETMEMSMNSTSSTAINNISSKCEVDEPHVINYEAAEPHVVTSYEAPEPHVVTNYEAPEPHVVTKYEAATDPNQPPNQLSCDLCGYSTNVKCNLAEHIRQKHRLTTNKKCSRTRSSYYNKGFAGVHLTNKY